MPPAKKGGKLTMLGSSDVDYVDPGHTYYTFGYR
jgi:peptide/nickel transport system substrate-binding protein